MYRPQPKTSPSPPAPAHTKPAVQVQAIPAVNPQAQAQNPNPLAASPTSKHQPTTTPATTPANSSSSTASAFLLCLCLVILVAQFMTGAFVASALDDVHGSLKKFNEVVQTTTITTTVAEYTTYVDWRAPYITKTAYGLTKVEAGKTVTETVLPTKGPKRRRRRDGGTAKTRVDTVYTPEAMVRSI